jgi:hypothetical protein
MAMLLDPLPGRPVANPAEFATALELCRTFRIAESIVASSLERERGRYEKSFFTGISLLATTHY